MNSGSSANLAMLFAEQCVRDKKDLKIVAPAVSWSTTVAPAIQLGMDVYLCDSDEDSLGVSINHLEILFKKHNPDLLIIVHVLGHINDMESICAASPPVNKFTTIPLIWNWYNSNTLESM